MSEHSSPSVWRAQPLGRRGFLRVSVAATATATLVVATGCDTETPTPVEPNLFSLVLPAGDPGLLYYAYLLALAQATLYQKVVDSPPADLAAAERAIFADLRDHEVIYREVFRYGIDPTGERGLLPNDFAFNLKSFALTTRTGVLDAAQQLEDLAAAAYSVLGPLSAAANVTQQTLLLKMASVQARHAATVRDLRTPGSFAGDDVVEATGTLAGQLRSKTPAEVTAALAPFFAPYVISVAQLATPA